MQPACRRSLVARWATCACALTVAWRGVQAKVDAGVQAPVKELLSGAASPIFWDGLLVLQSEVGM